MAILKCKMCGGQLSFEEGATVCECEYCGSKQTIPAVDDEKKITLYERANRLRFNSEFDKAAGVYENIVADFPEEAEAYWGLVLCRYGIEYVDDPATGKKVPTCHRSSFDSVMDDSDFEMVMENADSIARSVYREQAKQIEEIRKGIVEISGKEAPYDIFICYKETAEDGQRTIDSVLAQDVYDALTAKSYRVFFSRITLEDKLGTEYEPYIFAALNSAKVMLAFGTSYDYYNAVWVKNEWSRYLKLMAKDKTKHLIPCYKNIDAYDIPKEFAKLQAQDLGKVGAVQDLLRGIDKLIGKNASNTTPAQQNGVVQQNSAPNANALLQRGFNALEDEDFDAAENFFNRVLDSDATCAEGYLGLFMVDIFAWNKSEVERQFRASIPGNFDRNKNYQRAKKYANDTLAIEISSWEKMSAEEESKRVEAARIEKEKQLAAEQAAKEAAAKEKAELDPLLEEYKTIDTAEIVYTDADNAVVDKLKAVVKKAQDECDKAKNNYASSDYHNEKKRIENEISEKERYLSTLGLFKGKEKASVKEQIDALSKKKQSIEAKLTELAVCISEKEALLEVAMNALSHPESEIRSARKKAIEKELESRGMGIFKDVEPGDLLKFGSYEQDRGAEPIEWIVLAAEGTRRLLISKYAIEIKEYNEEYKEITWAQCSLRQFLNAEFLQNAFSETQRTYIKSTKLSNPNNPEYKISGGEDTIDKVFCLSIGEASKYFKSNVSRACKPTEYVKSKDAYTDDKTGNCWWWLRSPGLNNRDAAYVNADGSVNSHGFFVSIDTGAVRPALWINLEI